MKRIKLLVFGLLALSVVVSCDNDDAPLTETADSEIAIGLSLNDHISSRDAAISSDVLDSERYIIAGEYSIIMNLDSYKNQPHCCRFGVSPLDKRRGNIYVLDNSGAPGSAPLKWSDVKVNSFDFSIDNIGYDEECSFDEAGGFLGRQWSDVEKSETYAAQKEAYDDATGKPIHTNDIIWGAGKALKGTDGKEVSYAELTHRMSRVCVAFVNLTEQQQIGMTVSLTNLVLKPESFNRADGTVAVAPDATREDLLLLNTDEKLELLGDDTADDEYDEHVTANFILPPQVLTEEFWPEIVVTYTDVAGDEKVVRGLIPHDVLNEEGSNWEALDGLNAGNHLTIVAEINDDIPDIVFTAKVRKWVDLGVKTVTAFQDPGAPGIRSLKDLERCIELYNDLQQFQYPDGWDWVWNTELRKKHWAELMQYGDYKIVNYAGTDLVAWTFYIDFDLAAEPLPETKFRYMLCRLAKDFNDPKTDYTQWTYPLTFVDRFGTGLNLDDALTGGYRDPNYQGIYNVEDLNHFIKAVNEWNIGFMLFYSVVSALPDRWVCTINIRDDFSGNIINKMNPVVLANLSYEGKHVEVRLESNGYTVNGENGNDNIGALIGL